MTELLNLIEITELTPPKTDDFLGDAAADFLGFKALSLRPKSVKTYTESLNQLITYFRSDRLVTTITEKEIAAWLLQIDRAPSSVFMIWQTAKFFFAWFFAADPAADPMQRIHLKRPKRDPIKGVTADQVRRMLQRIDGPDAIRNRAIVSVLFCSGLRREEFCSLTLADINGRTGAINVRSEAAKGGKFRQVFIQGDSLRALNKYLRRIDAADPAAALWRTRSGSALKPAGVAEILEKACSAAGVENYSFHDFRRGCALEMKRKGADIKAISHFLGHADLKTTERYLALDDADARQTAVLFDPLKY